MRAWKYAFPLFEAADIQNAPAAERILRLKSVSRAAAGNKVGHRFARFDILRLARAWLAKACSPDSEVPWELIRQMPRSPAKTKSARKAAPAASSLFGPILVPTDFSPESERAIEYASMLVKSFGGALHLVHVAEPEYARTLSSLLLRRSLPPVAEIEKYHRGALKMLANWHGMAAKVHVRRGRAFDEICRLAKEMHAQLIVISTHGRTGLKRVLIGSTAERVVQHAPCPVLVLRERERVFAEVSKVQLEKVPPHKFTILVPVDFSGCSRDGLNYALWLARAWEAQLVVMHSVQIQPFIAPNRFDDYVQTPSLAAIERAAKGQMREFIKQTDFGDVQYQTVMRAGNPGQQICQFANDRAIDLIVTSTHGHTGLTHVLLGSVAEHVVRYAPGPVLVVRGIKQKAGRTRARRSSTLRGRQRP